MKKIVVSIFYCGQKLVIAYLSQVVQLHNPVLTADGLVYGKPTFLTRHRIDTPKLIALSAVTTT